MQERGVGDAGVTGTLAARRSTKTRNGRYRQYIEHVESLHLSAAFSRRRRWTGRRGWAPAVWPPKRPGRSGQRKRRLCPRWPWCRPPSPPPQLGPRGRCRGGQSGPEADHQERGVVDTQDEGEHQGEVQCPDRHRAIWSAKTKAPAAKSRPTMVSMRGRQAATRLPKATARTAIVTGQESNKATQMASRPIELPSQGLS
jgi:hypothetical protein